MSEENKRCIEVSTNKMYQLLISECRYGYNRNNHLMPSGAYDDVKNFFPEIDIKDHECALATAKQLCEECISDQLNTNFYEGLDDEFGNRKEAIEFIEYLLDFVHKTEPSFKPYNYDSYQDNINRVNSMKYNLYKLNEKLEYLDIDSPSLKGEKTLIIKGLNRNDIEDHLFIDILGKQEIEFNKIDIHDEENPRKIKGRFLRILTPIDHKNEVYLIIKE